MTFKKIMRPGTTPVSESVPFCMLLAVVGGFLDAYTFVGRGGVFCNAQTGNIVLLGVYLSTGRWQLALDHVPPHLRFCSWSVFSRSDKKKSIAASLSGLEADHFAHWNGRSFCHRFYPVICTEYDRNRDGFIGCVDSGFFVSKVSRFAIQHNNVHR